MKVALAFIILLVALVACAEKTTNNTNTGAQADANDDFNALFAKRNTQWKVAYDLTTDAGGEQTQYQMTQYMKGENRFRYDMVVEGGETRMYMVDNVYTTCTKSGTWQCFKITTNDTQQNPASSTLEWEQEYEQNMDDYNIFNDGTKVIAGVTAKCFKIAELQNTKTVTRYCFSDQGVPLYTYFSDGTTISEMTATSYSTSVTDNDFKPPAEAQDIGSMYGTSPEGGDACAYCNYLSGTDKQECLASC